MHLVPFCYSFLGRSLIFFRQLLTKYNSCQSATGVAEGELPSGIVFRPNRKRYLAFCALLKAPILSEAGKLKTEFGAKTMAHDPGTERIFVDTG